MFVAIEGLDGSGGTTQLRRLADALAAHARPVHTTREPSDGPVGRFIREHLPGGVLGDPVFAALFAADRADHLAREIEPALARGAWVLTDRYLLSSLAYQALSVGLDRVWALNADFRPADVTIVLDLAVDACLARVLARGGTRDRFETRDRLLAIDAAYAAAIARCRARGDRIVSVDASGSVDDVHARVWRAVWPG